MKKILFSVFVGLLAYWVIGLFFPFPVFAQPNTISGAVVDQSDNPVAGATVIATIPGYPTDQPPTATSDSSGQFSMSVPYNKLPDSSDISYTLIATGPNGEQGSAVATISPSNSSAVVTIVLGENTTPYPPPGPGPSPDCAGYYESCINKECCEGLIKQFGSEQTGACTCVYPTPPSRPGSPTCRPQLTGERDSRPYYNQNCDLCNATSDFCPSCATSFTVFDTVSWKWHEKDFDCEGNDWKRTPWEGKITIDPTQTTIPFVGKKREDDINKREDEQKYLADYFDGTHEYYRSYDVQKVGKTIYHGTNTTLLPNYQGVLRKLTPMEYQDELKKEMVQRAQEASSTLEEGNIHNYNVAYKSRLCWDLPFLGDAAIGFTRSIAGETETNFSSLFSFLANISHYCLYNFTPGIDDAKLTIAEGAIDAFNALITPLGPLGNLFKIQTEGKIDGVEKTLTEIDGNFPPEPDEENYVEKWRAWKDSEWGRVWEAVPMVSREDTPGGIYPYLGSKPEDTFTILNPDAQIERVPHVARLYESSQEVQNILLPTTEGGLTSQKETTLILASSESPQPLVAGSTKEEVLGEKTLIAQGYGEPSFSTRGSCTREGNKYTVSLTVSFSLPSGHSCRDINVEIQYPTYWQHTCPNETLCGGLVVTPFPVISQPGGSVNVIYYVKAHGVNGPPGSPWAPNTELGGAIPIQFTENGCIIEGEAPPAPACGLPPALPVNKCELTAITDTNPNDELCCNQINIDLKAVDIFDEYPSGCEYDITCCNNALATIPCLCNPECNTEETRGVNREIGVALSHPYLGEIWNNTAEINRGIFNIFRPFGIAEFEDLDAKSKIQYSWTGKAYEPHEGNFYYPYLGGIQKAKEWVTTKVLMPYVEQ